MQFGAEGGATGSYCRLQNSRMLLKVCRLQRRDRDGTFCSGYKEYRDFLYAMYLSFCFIYYAGYEIFV